MSPPHNLATLAPPRTLANVLLDLKEARDDWRMAIDQDGDDAEDRATEADQRIDNLRDEFATAFQAATGLTWKQVEAAVQDAVL